MQLTLLVPSASVRDDPRKALELRPVLPLVIASREGVYSYPLALALRAVMLRSPLERALLMSVAPLTWRLVPARERLPLVLSSLLVASQRATRLVMLLYLVAAPLPTPL
jgi:hypothetical protein